MRINLRKIDSHVDISCLASPLPIGNFQEELNVCKQTMLHPFHLIFEKMGENIKLTRKRLILLDVQPRQAANPLYL
jgi:hypothetical protein